MWNFKRRNLALIAAGLLLLLFLFFLLRQLGVFQLDTSSISYMVMNGYSSVIANLYASILELFGATINYSSSSNSILLENNSYIFVWFSILSILMIPIVSGLWFLRRPALKAVFLWLFTMLSFFFSGVFIVWITDLVTDSGDMMTWFFRIKFFSLVEFLIFAFFVLRIKEPSKHLSWLIEKFQISKKDWIIRFKILFSIPLAKLLFETVLSPYLTMMVSYPSQWITNAMGLNSWVDSIFLRSENTYVIISYACLGINAMLLFALLILMLNYGTWKSKIKYILLGIFSITGINIIRISFLFRYYSINNGQDIRGVDTHDLYNVFVYGFIFLLWVIWIEQNKQATRPV